MDNRMTLHNIVAGHTSAAIAGHVNPDGDCVGSTIALYTYLKKRYPFLAVDLYLEEIPDSYRFLTYSEVACDTLYEDRSYDILFTLDSATPERIGVAGALCAEAKCVVNIDHHISNPNYGTVNIVYPDSSSTSEIIYELIGADGGSIDYDMAQALYLGIMQDTGVFKYSNTSQRTMEIAGALMNVGIPFSDIVDKTFFEKTHSQAQILGLSLVKSRITEDGSAIYTLITQEDKNTYGVTDSDMDGISSQMLQTKDVYASVFVREVQEDVYKASLRSKTDLVDVNRTASLYGGGGHKRAAGCTIKSDVEEAIRRLTADISVQVIESQRDSEESALACDMSDEQYKNRSATPFTTASSNVKGTKVQEGRL